MSPYVRRSVLLVCLGAALAQSASAGQESDPNDPHFVLAQIQKRLDAISNYQCTQVTALRRPSQHDLNLPPVIDSEKKHLAYNSQGHGRIRDTDDNLDATSTIWDGTRTIRVHERVKPNGTVIYSASIVPGKYIESSRGNRPWSCLGGSLVRRLAQALEDGTEISIEPTKDRHCRLEIRHEYTAIITVLDPERGYLPIREEMIAQGKLHHRADIEFRKVDPGVWFPSAVWTSGASQQMHPSGPPVPRRRFTDVTINAPDFDRLLTPDLPDGSTVADEIRGVRYVVDHRRGWNLTGKASSPLDADAAAPGPSASVYRLDANQAIKRIAAPFAPDRSQLIASGEPDQDPVSEAALDNTLCVFQWDDALKPKVSHTGMGFLKLSEILQYVCGLDIAQYSGPENLLELRLTGDWIVRRDASVAECLRALEHTVNEETGLNITFKKRRVEAQIARATGIFHYHPLPGAWGENDIQLFADRSIDERGTRTDRGSGTLAQLLRHITNRTGKRFVDDTLSSDMDVSWSDYTSSKLNPLSAVRQMYRYDLAQLLEHVAQQTGLAFAMERRTIDEWHLSIKPLSDGVSRGRRGSYLQRP